TCPISNEPGSVIFCLSLGQGERIEVRSSKPNRQFSEQTLTPPSSLRKARRPMLAYTQFPCSLEVTIDLLCFFVKDREMFLPPRRITCSSITSLLLGLTLLFAVSARAAQTFPKCCVWRVTNAKAPFYLVGSIHALSKKDYPLPAPYELALKNSRRFLFEFDPSRHVEFEKKFETAGK